MPRAGVRLMQDGQPVSGRVCVIGAGPCGLTAIKNLLSVGIDDVVCYDEGAALGGNWVYDDQPGRSSVYWATHLISSKRLSEFEDFPMPDDYPDFPSHQQVLGYFKSYARCFNLSPKIVLNTRVEKATQLADGSWSIVTRGPEGNRVANFDYLIICSGHHRDPLIPDYPGTFAGQVLHSQDYKRPEPFINQRVLVVGGGNSACDIAVDVARLAASSRISLRHGCYILPKIMFGRPTDIMYARLRRYWPFVRDPIASLAVRLAVGPWDKYGLEEPAGSPLSMHPTLNSAILSALRDGSVLPRPGIERLDGDLVRFRDGSAEAFDAIIWATGYRFSYPFLDEQVLGAGLGQAPPLYLTMMHRKIESLFFIGLFQPIGCIWRLADHQAKIAALQIKGRLRRPADIGTRIDRETRSRARRYGTAPRHLIEVDYHDFRNDLLHELGPYAA
jgi:thioredoxin reductase